ncbi:MAG: nucleotidyl transferase AbiEii/AbiGii toxin family protein [Anaerostipes sp.]|jgi:predicted nucleotidyltransferase component of viral defense system|nr:nucleotidyl transferase AbiEii/AbiGii toxin family protein [Anaerostipes sp.]
MVFRNVDAWKTAMKRIAKERGLDIQDVQQRYVLEEFAEKIGASKYGNSLVLKGGFIVSTILGLDTRMTRDLDITCRSTIYNLDEVRSILKEIIQTKTKSFFEYKLVNIKEAQEDDKYSGFIVLLQASNNNTNIKLKLDISNNTLIYPEAIRTEIDSLFSNEKIRLASYPIENIIAEKFETTLDRGEFNTRMRDLFDVYLLMKENGCRINEEQLAQTIIEVSKDRGTLENLEEFEEMIQYLGESDIFCKNFEKYRKDQYPNQEISLSQVFEQFQLIHKLVENILLS